MCAAPWSRDTIYTIKLRHRGHHVPQDRHANLYLVQQAGQIMEHQFIAAESGTMLIQVLESYTSEASLMPPVVVGRNGHIVGIVPPRSGLWPQALRDASFLIVLPTVTSCLRVRAICSRASSKG